MRLRFPVLTVSLLLSLTAFAGTFTAGGPVSTNNDDSCDIGLYPAATLLLPYFDVDLANPNGETTLFTVTNVSPDERIANVTIWTDLAYPVLSFPIYLTGYDVQSINLYDVIQNGRIAPPRGTGTSVSPQGDFSRRNFELDRSECLSIPSQLSEETISRLKQALVIGRVPAQGSNPQCLKVGTVHGNVHAAGYVTIDVVRACRTLSPADAAYYVDTIAYDNVLIGEWIQVDRSRRFAEGNQMVHIRAIPEGETTAVRAAFPEIYRSNFPRTFYGRFTGNSKSDGRQPLPSRLAARWIHGGAGAYNTELTIWREPQTGTGASCASYADNGDMTATEFVTFDENENAVGFAVERGPIDPPLPPDSMIVLPAQRRAVDRDDTYFPFPANDALSGWMYLNLDSQNSAVPSQAWVVATMRAEGLHSVSFDAVALGNGCSPAVGESNVTHGNTPIGPSGNINP